MPAIDRKVFVVPRVVEIPTEFHAAAVRHGHKVGGGVDRRGVFKWVVRPFGQQAQAVVIRMTDRIEAGIGPTHDAIQRKVPQELHIVGRIAAKQTVIIAVQHAVAGAQMPPFERHTAVLHVGLGHADVRKDGRIGRDFHAGGRRGVTLAAVNEISAYPVAIVHTRSQTGAIHTGGVGQLIARAYQRIIRAHPAVAFIKRLVVRIAGPAVDAIALGMGADGRFPPQPHLRLPQVVVGLQATHGRRQDLHRNRFEVGQRGLAAIGGL